MPQMNHPVSLMRIRPARLLAALLMAVGASSTLVGCDSGDEAGQKIAQARAMLAALGSSGQSTTEPTRAQMFRDVISSMQTVQGKGQPAAKLLAAHAMLGESDIASAAQRAAEADVATRTSATRNLFELVVAHESRAASLEGHDQAKARGDLSDKIAAFEAGLKAAETKRADLAGQLELLKAKFTELGQKAAQLRQAAGELRATAASATAEARLKIIEDSARIQREADRVEVDQAELDLVVQDAARKVSDSARDIETLQRQKSLTEQAVDRVQKSETLLASQASDARAQAKTAAASLARSFEDLMNAIEQNLSPAYQQTTAKLNTAASTAASGRDADANLSKALTGLAHQALASSHGGYAGVVERAADLASRLGARPSLPDAAKYQQAATKLTELAKPARESAASASAQAGASFQSVGGQGKAADIFKRIGDSLTPLSESQAPAEPPVQDAAPAGGETTPPPADESGATPGEPAPESTGDKPADAPAEPPAPGGSAEPK